MDFTAALNSARTLAQVDDLARDLWRTHGAGLLADTDAERVAAQVEEARRRIRPADTAVGRAPHVPTAPSNFPPRRRRCASPDRLASRTRRLRLQRAPCRARARGRVRGRRRAQGSRRISAPL